MFKEHYPEIDFEKYKKSKKNNLVLVWEKWQRLRRAGIPIKLPKKFCKAHQI